MCVLLIWGLLARRGICWLALSDQPISSQPPQWSVQSWAQAELEKFEVAHVSDFLLISKHLISSLDIPSPTIVLPQEFATQKQEIYPDYWIAHWEWPKHICYHCYFFSSWLMVRSGASPKGLSTEGKNYAVLFSLEFNFHSSVRCVTN